MSFTMFRKRWLTFPYLHLSEFIPTRIKTSPGLMHRFEIFPKSYQVIWGQHQYPLLHGWTSEIDFIPRITESLQSLVVGYCTVSSNVPRHLCHRHLASNPPQPRSFMKMFIFLCTWFHHDFYFVWMFLSFRTIALNFKAEDLQLPCFS